MQNYSDEQRDAFFKMIDDMKASDFGVQHFLTHSLDDTMILDTEMLDENTIRLHMGHKTKYGEFHDAKAKLKSASIPKKHITGIELSTKGAGLKWNSFTKSHHRAEGLQSA